MNRPRRRMLDPGLWANPELGELPLAARLLYIGLVSFADDEGRVRADPRQLRAWVFPYDGYGAEEVGAWLEALADKGLVRLYRVGGQQYAAHPNWERYQQISPTKRQGSQWPAPPAWAEVTADANPEHPAVPAPLAPAEGGVEEEARAEGAGGMPEVGREAGETASDAERGQNQNQESEGDGMPAPEASVEVEEWRVRSADDGDRRPAAANGAEPRQTAADGGERRPAAADGAEFRLKRREVKRREENPVSVLPAVLPRARKEGSEEEDTQDEVSWTERSNVAEDGEKIETPRDHDVAVAGIAPLPQERLARVDGQPPGTGPPALPVPLRPQVVVIREVEPDEGFVPDPTYSANRLLGQWRDAGLPLPRSVHWAAQEDALGRLHREPPHWSQAEVLTAIDKLVADHRGPRVLAWAWRHGPAYLVRRRTADEPQGIEKVLEWQPLRPTGTAAETVQERLARRQREREEKQHVQTDG